MALTMLQLSFYVITVIQLTSSQPTCDDDPNDIQSKGCGNVNDALNDLQKDNSQLATTVSQLLVNNSQMVTANSQLQTSVSQLMTTVSQLHNEVGILKNASRPHNARDCPSDFIYNATVNGCYKVVSHNVEWLLAGLECRALHKDAHLVVINDADEQSAVGQLLDSINDTALSGCNSDSVQGIYFWTAGQRIDPSRKSAFIWRVTSTSPCGETWSTMTYTYWHSGQPDYFNQDEACVNLCRSHSHAWNDFPCYLETCFICEIDL